MKKKDVLNLFLLTLLVFVVIFFSVYPDKIFGSVTDWGSQHTMFPEYFRTLFYQTGDLFPDFMMHLGAGQNIYNISYYGLLNPIVLLSYLFPFIKMVDFMIIASILMVLFSIYLCYYWLSKKGFSRTIVMVTSIVFACASPLIFHSHRHIMFMTYMPFLLLGLIGIDHYFKSSKRFLLTISVCAMILTSYYYSIGGILVLCCYGLYSYLRRENRITFKIVIDGVKFLYPILLGIGLSGILLLPTAYVIFTGRSSGGSTTALMNLLVPHLDISALVYSSYSIGLSAIAVLALFHTFFTRKAENIFLGISLLVVLGIPIIMYVLNGFLYIRAKVLIPFLPLFVYLIARLLQDMENKKCNVKLEAIILILLSFFWYWRGYHEIIFYVDLAFCIIFLLSYYKWNKKFLYVIPMILVSFIVVFVSNRSETYETVSHYSNAFHKNKEALIEEVIKDDTSFYRMNDLTDTLLTSNKVYQDRYYSTSLYSSVFHQSYKDFFYDTMGNADTYRNRFVTSSSSNIFFQTFMGVKYVIAKKGEPMIGYQLLKENGEYGLYKNDLVYPLGYVTDQVYQKSFYDDLFYPYNVELLMNGVVVEGKGMDTFSTNIEEFSISYPENVEGLEVTKKENGYTVKANKAVSFKVPLTEKLEKNQLLMIRFRLDKSQNCKEGDLSIAINGITNKLTCKQWMYHNGNYEFEYVLGSEEGLNELDVHMNAGSFEIVDIHYYVLDYNSFKDRVKEFDVFDIDYINGDKIEGTINVTKNGYFVLSIPYDESFVIKVDGKEQPFEKVDETFIGFELQEGERKIEIVYEAPLKKMGSIISLISLFLLGAMVYQDNRK